MPQQAHTVVRRAFNFGFAFGVHISKATHEAGGRVQPEGEAVETGCTAANAVNVPQTGTNEHHPLASVSGLFANDPLWPEYLAAINELQEEENADE